MKVLAAALCATVFAAVLTAQPIPFYSSNEDYCAKNPQAPTCKDGKPMDMRVVAPNTDEWCEKYPSTLGCRDGHYVGMPKWGAIAPRKTAPAAYTAVPSTIQAAPQANPPSDYRIPAPLRGRKGSPADIRLGEMDWRLIHPQPDLLIGMNLANLVESDVARTLLSEWTGKLGATQAEQEKLLASLGNLTEAVVSVHQKELIAVLIGRLDDFPESAQIGGMQCMRVSADTVMLGSPDALRWALHRQKFALPATAQLNEVQQLNYAYQFWAWAKPGALASLGQGMRGNSPITKIKFGANLKDGFRMDMIVDATDAAAAKRMLESSSKSAPRDLQASLEGTSVHYVMALDRGATFARFGGFMTDSVGKQFAPLLAAARQIAGSKASAAARPSPGKIVIEGLDDGPKEVPLEQK